jgi:hypothetical protein
MNAYLAKDGTWHIRLADGCELRRHYFTRLHSPISVGADRPTGRIAVISPTPEPDPPDPVRRQTISRPTPRLTIHNQQPD